MIFKMADISNKKFLNCGFCTDLQQYMMDPKVLMAMLVQLPYSLMSNTYMTVE